MLTATEILYHAAGNPPIPGCEATSGSCWLCGAAMTAGIPKRAFVKPTFTDFDKIACPESTHICPACAFSFEQQSEPLARRLDKPGTQNMRNYSHFVVDGEWWPLSKAQKAVMADLLLNRRPELAVIAESGQKHLIFRATPGLCQFEEMTLLPQPQRLFHILTAVTEAYAIFSKTEIESGHYSQARILKFGPARWEQLERQFRSWRGSVLFRLAVFLAQREDVGDHAASQAQADCGD